MKKPIVDYDYLSCNYDEAKAFGPQTMALWSNLLKTLLLPSDTTRVLDIGSGTGRFARLFVENLGCRVTAVDPSCAMLRKLDALALSQLDCINGNAEQLPIPDGTFDAVFMSSVVHHFSDVNRAFSEAFRVLQEGGRLGVRFATHAQLRRRMDFRFFPTLEDLFSKRPDQDDIESMMLDVGFRELWACEVQELFIESKTEYLRKLEIRHSSALSLLPPDDYDEGVRKAKEHFTRHDLQEEEKHEFMTLLVGEKLHTRDEPA